MTTPRQLTLAEQKVDRLAEELDEAKQRLAELQVQQREKDFHWLPGKGWVGKG